MMKIKLVIGSDHAGFKLKEEIKKYLKNKYDIIDVGTYSEEPCDYPDYACKAVEMFFNTNSRYGILICGTGIGMSIVANKFRGIRAALVYNIKTAILSRKHNHANFLCLGGRILSIKRAIRIVDTWLNTSEERGRHQRRVQKISELENKFNL